MRVSTVIVVVTSLFELHARLTERRSLFRLGLTTYYCGEILRVGKLNCTAHNITPELSLLFVLNLFAFDLGGHGGHCIPGW